MTPSITSRVRLIPAERLAQPEIGEAVGVVRDVAGEVVQVAWLGELSWVRCDYLEIVPTNV